MSRDEEASDEDCFVKVTPSSGACCTIPLVLGKPIRRLVELS